MIDGASAIDPLIAEGPLLPVENLRPAASMQRVLFLDGAGPMMADLATGDIRPWENGPPVSVPVPSTTFDAADIARLQVQVLRDPRPTSVDSVLLSVAFQSDAVDVVETTAKTLVIRHRGAELAAGPIGGSPAVVIVLEPNLSERCVLVHARNAETLQGITAEVPSGDNDPLSIMIGGPTTSFTGTYGRRRLIPVHIDLVRPVAPTDHVRRAAAAARRVAVALKNRAG